MGVGGGHWSSSGPGVGSGGGPCTCRRGCAHAPAVLSYTTGVGDQVPGRLTVHPRVHRRHPELAEADVVAAWEGALVSGRTLEELGAPRRRP